MTRRSSSTVAAVNEEDNWLASSYLSNTCKPATDRSSRLNPVHSTFNSHSSSLHGSTGAAAAAAAAATATADTSKPAGQTPPANMLQVVSEAKSSGARHPSSSSDDLRRRSWAAPAGVNQIAIVASPARGSPAKAAGEGGTSGGGSAGASPSQRGGAVRKSREEVERILLAGGNVVGSPSGLKRRSQELETATAGVFGKGGGGGSTETEMELQLRREAKGTGRKSRKSMSGSGRRASLDYTDLEAVKERVMQAASMWAIDDEDDEDDPAIEAAPKADEQCADASFPRDKSDKSVKGGKMSLFKKWFNKDGK